MATSTAAGPAEPHYTGTLAALGSQPTHHKSHSHDRQCHRIPARRKIPRPPEPSPWVAIEHPGARLGVTSLTRALYRGRFIHCWHVACMFVGFKVFMQSVYGAGCQTMKRSQEPTNLPPTVGSRSTRRQLSWYGYLCLAIILPGAGTGCSRNPLPQGEEATPSAAPLEPSAFFERNEPEPLGSVPTGVSGWQLSFPASSAGPGSVVAATVDSANDVPTVRGPRHPVLVVRCDNSNLEVFVKAYSMGETVPADGAQRGVLFRVQYDSESGRTFLATESADHESFLIPNRELARIAKADTLHMSFTQFQASPVDFAFNVSGFEDVAKALKEECPATP
jgi:hypothetical protein